MGRWRPPQKAGSPHITPAGYEALQEELKALWKRRADVVKALSAAAAEGDRSENAEYIYRKKELGGLDRRIRYLQKRLPNLTVVRDVPVSDRVFFGARIVLKRDDNSEVTYRIVGADEADAGKGDISVDSPLARALLKKGADDEFSLRLEDQEQHFTVLRIDYKTDS